MLAVSVVHFKSNTGLYIYKGNCIYCTQRQKKHISILKELIASHFSKFEASAHSKFSDYTKHEGCTSKLPSILLGLHSLKGIHDQGCFVFF